MIAQHLYMMAFEHHRAGRFREAEAVYRAALRHDPQLAGALCNLGILSHRAGEEAAALDYLRRALDADPESALACSNPGTWSACPGFEISDPSWWISARPQPC